MLIREYAVVNTVALDYCNSLFICSSQTTIRHLNEWKILHPDFFVACLLGRTRHLSSVADPKPGSNGPCPQTHEKLCNLYGTVADNSVKYVPPDGFYGIQTLINSIRFNGGVVSCSPQGKLTMPPFFIHSTPLASRSPHLRCRGSVSCHCWPHAVQRHQWRCSVNLIYNPESQPSHRACLSVVGHMSAQPASCSR